MTPAKRWTILSSLLAVIRCPFLYYTNSRGGILESLRVSVHRINFAQLQDKPKVQNSKQHGSYCNMLQDAEQGVSHHDVA